MSENNLEETDLEFLETPAEDFFGEEVAMIEEPVIEEVKPVKKAKTSKDDTVALYSSRNVHWEGFGNLSIGYNIVSQEDAEVWLKRNHVRLAAPEEVAGGYIK